MWKNAGHDRLHLGVLRRVQGGCQDADTFTGYIKKCQVTTTFYFNVDREPLAEQLKALYLKQEFSKFAIANQGERRRGSEHLPSSCEPPSHRTRGPSWRPGASRSEIATVGSRG
jgi:hypothetical protein